MNKTLNLEYMNARKLILPNIEMVNLVLIGCGGTGSWLAPSVVRFARMLTEKFDRDVKITFVDPDQVEPKNVYRQNFCEAEVGAYKAEALAFRYGTAWGMSIVAIDARFHARLDLPTARNGNEYLTVLIGCVDNAAARQEIEKRVYASERSETVWWLDCGNKKTVGQVLLGRAPTRGENPLLFEGLCSWLPLPSVQHPELVDVSSDMDNPEPEPDAMLSCAELAMRGTQSLSINCRMAASAGEMLGKFLLTNDLEYFATYIDQAVGETRKFITDPAIEAYLDLERIAR